MSKFAPIELLDKIIRKMKDADIPVQSVEFLADGTIRFNTSSSLPESEDLFTKWEDKL